MQEYKVIVDDDGTIRYYKPGTKELHRLDGPAIEHASGDKFWYQNGKCHRLDGPAAEHASGTKSWYQNGERHRVDGPAIERADGGKVWYRNGKRHRIDGPAVENTDGTVEYWINNKPLTEEQFKKATAPKPKEMTVAEIEAVLGHSVKIIK